MNEPGRVSYISYIWHDGTVSQFRLRNPKAIDFIGTSDPKFSFSMPDGSGWRDEELLNFKGADGSNWVTKCHSSYGKIWFASGHPGETRRDGEMPILIDNGKRMWRVLDPSPGTDGFCTVVLREYFK